MWRKPLLFFLFVIILFLSFPFFHGCTTSRKITFEGKSLTEVVVKDVRMDPDSMTPVVILQDLSENIYLPIWIGSNEALAIATPMQDVTFYRPMTHDLLQNILGELHATVLKVVITEIRGRTFYAVILIKNKGKDLVIDSRPSDAIALAIRVDAPIFISTDLLHSKGIREGVEQL